MHWFRDWSFLDTWDTLTSTRHGLASIRESRVAGPDEQDLG